MPFHPWQELLVWTQSWTNCRLCWTASLLNTKLRKMQWTTPSVPTIQVRKQRHQSLLHSVLVMDHWLIPTTSLTDNRKWWHQIICFVLLSYLGAFSAIKDAYDESTDAAKRVDASGNKVKESADVREETTDLLNQTQPANTRDLDNLNQSMASQPDLTPVAKQVTTSSFHQHKAVMLACLSKSVSVHVH